MSRRAGRCTDRLVGEAGRERERSDRPGSNRRSAAGRKGVRSSNRRSTGPAGRRAGCSTESGRPGNWGTHKSAPAPGGRPPHPGRGLAPPGSRRILTPNPRRRFDPAATDPREPITAREVRLYGVLRPGPATFRPRPVNGAQNGSEEPPDDFPAPRAGETGRGPRRRACRIRAGPSASGPPRTSWDTADRGQVLLDRRHRSGCPRPEVSRCSPPRQTSA